MKNKKKLYCDICGQFEFNYKDYFSCKIREKIFSG